MFTTTARKASLADLEQMLRDQRTRSRDFVAPAGQVRFRDDGVLSVEGTEAVLTEDGVSTTAGLYRPTAVFLEGLASKLEIPVGYLKRTYETRPDIFSATANAWLSGRKAKFRHTADGPVELRPAIDADPRNFLCRTFATGGEGEVGIARALLSNKYEAVDHLDALVAALAGVREAGVEVNIDSCDLSERRMRVRVVAPGVAAHAPRLLDGYRSPYGGASGTENPVVFSGFIISNSEVGDGAYTITPRLVVQICNNGMTINRDVVRAVHLGSLKSAGAVDWSADTQRKILDVVTAKTRDLVATVLSPAYVEKQLRTIEQQAGHEVSDAAHVVETVTKQLQFPESVRASVLDHFIRGSQMTSGGVLNAVTAAAQEISDPELAATVEEAGLDALAIAATL